MKKQRVVCVRYYSLSNPDRIKVGEIYTIQGVCLCAPEYVHLEEVQLLTDRGCKACGKIHQDGFRASDFRPVDETFGEVTAERIEEMVEYEQATKEVTV